MKIVAQTVDRLKWLKGLPSKAMRKDIGTANMWDV
jgi:hypothetical protein